MTSGTSRTRSGLRGGVRNRGCGGRWRASTILWPLTGALNGLVPGGDVIPMRVWKDGRMRAANATAAHPECQEESAATGWPGQRPSADSAPTAGLPSPPGAPNGKVSEWTAGWDRLTGKDRGEGDGPPGGRIGRRSRSPRLWGASSSMGISGRREERPMRPAPWDPAVDGAEPRPASACRDPGDTRAV